jgi:dihydrofolate reductase
MSHKKSAPRFIAIAAVTIDGKIALHSKHFTNWTSKEDKVFLHEILDTCDLVLVGRNTYEIARKPLSKRNCIVLTTKIDKIKQVNERLLFCNPKRVDLEKLVRERAYKKIAVLGGSQAYTYCLEKKLLDEIFLTIEPLVFGLGLNLFQTNRFRLKKFKLRSVKRLNPQGSLLLHYIKIN